MVNHPNRSKNKVDPFKEAYDELRGRTQGEVTPRSALPEGTVEKWVCVSTYFQNHYFYEAPNGQVYGHSGGTMHFHLTDLTMAEMEEYRRQRVCQSAERYYSPDGVLSDGKQW